MARIGFTPAPGVDVSDADAAVEDAKDPKTFYSVAAPIKTGTMPTVTIVAGEETYPAGYHAGDGGGLSAIDADLAPANIKKDVNIFGKVGTYEGVALAFTEHYNDELGGGATYTPAVVGMFVMSAESRYAVPQYQYSPGAWRSPQDITEIGSATCIGDGTNFRILNSGVAGDILVMRSYLAGMTYERYATVDIADLSTYTPTDAGMYTRGDEDPEIYPEVDFLNAGWDRAREVYTNVLQGCGFHISDGTNLRYYNGDGVNRQIVVMRAGY